MHMKKVWLSCPIPTEYYGVQAAVAAGVDSLEHGNYMDGETLEMLAESSTVWVPTLVTVINLLGVRTI